MTEEPARDTWLSKTVAWIDWLWRASLWPLGVFALVLSIINWDDRALSTAELALSLALFALHKIEVWLSKRIKLLQDLRAELKEANEKLTQYNEWRKNWS